MNQSTKNMKKSVIQDQKVDDNQQRKKNEENLKIPLNLFRSYTRITQQSLLEEIAPMMSQIEFLKKNCPEGTKIEEFAAQACSYFKYEQFSKGQIVFNYGEYGDKVYLILLGEVGVFVSKSQEEIANDREVIETYKSNMNPFEEEILDYETIFKKKKRAQDLQMELLLASQKNPFEINNMYFKDGICLYKKVFQFYSGQAFGDMALSSDKPRTASILVLSDELHVLTMNRLDFKSVGERSIKEKNQTFEYFLSIFVGVSKFIVTKFIQYFQKIEFAPQTILWKEGDEPKFFLLIVRGRVEIYRSYNEDALHGKIKEPSIFQSKIKPKKKVTLSQLSDNSFVGEAELIDNIPVRLYSCMTSDNTLAYYMESDAFNIVRKNHPDFLKILKEKSFVIKSYLQRREKYLFENIQKQDKAMEKLQYPDSTNTERVTVDELYRDTSTFNSKIFRSQQKGMITTTDIVNSNNLLSKKITPQQSENMFIFHKKQIELLKQKKQSQTKSHSTIPPITLQKSISQSNFALECQVLKSYRRMRFKQFQANREVCLQIKSQIGSFVTTQLGSSSHDSSLPQGLNDKCLKSLQEFYFAKTFITTNK
ncbi:unnamed protein product [Paramecium primaurelia]|uniref:Cyclic nucleotide-binding domain-containing protein n=1 Tax=Paramecium primaurelia TaxID=5886 RepID=A0A8S1P8A4_PARPR|nr:unnamed protein product [Paramecium primaurelia]